MPAKLKALQEALSLSDKDMAVYLSVDVTVFREAKAGTQELSAHAAAIVLDSLGFVKFSDAAMMLLTKKAREKLIEARKRQALTIAQKNELAVLAKKYREDGE